MIKTVLATMAAGSLLVAAALTTEVDYGTTTEQKVETSMVVLSGVIDTSYDMTYGLRVELETNRFEALKGNLTTSTLETLEVAIANTNVETDYTF